MNRCGRALLLGFLLAGAQGVSAQGLPVIRTVEVTEPRLFRQFWSVARDTSGLMVVGSSTGFGIYDGQRWSYATITGDEAVRALVTGPDGTLWYGATHHFGRIGADSLGRPVPKPLLPDLLWHGNPVGDISSIASDGPTTWFQTRNRLYHTLGDSVAALASAERMGLLLQTHAGLVVHRVGIGLQRVAPDGFRPVPGGASADQTEVFTVAWNRGDFTWLFSRQRGMVRFDADGLTPTASQMADSLRKHPAYRGTPVGDRHFAIATLSGGVFIMDAEGRMILNLRDDLLPTNAIYNVHHDAEGLLWIATDNGILVADLGYALRMYDSRNGLLGAPTSMVRAGNQVYAGTTAGLYRFDAMSPSPRPEAVPGIGRVYRLDARGDTAWAATAGGAYRLVGTTATRLTDGDVRWIRVAAADLVGIRNSMLFRMPFEGGRIQTLREWPQPTQNLLVRPEGIWLNSVSTGPILLKPDGSQKSYGIRAPGTSGYHEINVLSDTLWMAGAFGFRRYQARLDSFVHGSPFGTAVDTVSASVFFECGNERWYRRNQRLIRQVGGELVTTPYARIGAGESVQELACAPNGVWMAMFGGVYQITDPDRHPELLFNTRITRLSVGPDSLIWGGYGTPGTYVFPYRDNGLRFEYAAATYADPAGTRYRYHLEGFEPDWSGWSAESRKDYTNLPEGSYRFRVQAMDVYGRTGRETSVAFIIKPPWHRTWWAYTLYAIGIGILLWGIYTIRVRRLMREYNLRNRIALDLHDEVSATLSSIGYFAQAIPPDNLGTDGGKYLGLISESAGDAKEKITDIVWAITPENDDWEALFAKCRRYADDLLESNRLQGALVFEPRPGGKPDMLRRQHIWLMFKELLTNSVRHAGGTRVDISLRETDGRLELDVRDDGCGFDPESVHGNGVRNIRKRAEELGADVFLTTAPGRGTHWRIRMTMQARRNPLTS